MRLTVCIIFALLSSFTAYSQVTTATFYGIVTDSSGAAIVGAPVTLTNQGTNATLTSTTDGAGEFAFNFVPVGIYDLRIQAKRIEHAGHRSLLHPAR